MQECHGAVSTASVHLGIVRHDQSRQPVVEPEVEVNCCKVNTAQVRYNLCFNLQLSLLGAVHFRVLHQSKL